jgi:hypothetical protein
MKTAMQDMLEWVRATFPMDLNTPRMIEHKIESLLEKEKEQMFDFFLKGYSIGESDFNPKSEANKYYNQTYNQNK